MQELVDGKVVFTLFESGAILRYLADSLQVADHFYPKDLAKRMKID